MADFALGARWDRMSVEARDQLKLRVLDSIACAAGALGAPPVEAVRRQIAELGGSRERESRPGSTLIGGGQAAPDRAALYNSALVRYLDYNDSYLAPQETCHPSDNLGAILSAAEFVDSRGEEFLSALAVSYQVQCRLSDEAPVRPHGFDHTTQGAYALAAGLGRVMDFGPDQAANAIAIAGVSSNALRVTRTGALSNWKGLAYPYTAFTAVNAAFLARQGITGPPETIEGAGGLMDSITGRFEIDWSDEDLERVRETIVKKYDAEIHSQSAIEAAIEIRSRWDGPPPVPIDQVRVDTFDVAWHIIGGGSAGVKTEVDSKEAADHSLPYVISAALLDGRVSPEQYRPERIRREDIRDLMHKVQVRPDDELSRLFPKAMPARVVVRLSDGREFACQKMDYAGFHTRPAGWDEVVAKLDELAPETPTRTRERIVSLVRTMESRKVRELTGAMSLLGRA